MHSSSFCLWSHKKKKNKQNDDECTNILAHVGFLLNIGVGLGVTGRPCLVVVQFLT